MEPLRELYHQSVRPLAQEATAGAWYRGRRIVCLDGTTLDCADTPENEAGLGRPPASSGRSAYPQVRLVTLVEAGTHVMFALHLGRYEHSEHKLAGELRVIEYTLSGAAQSESRYRLITTLLDPEQDPAHELAALYAQRWQIETTFDELKTHLRGARVLLRSRTPELVHQEIYGLVLAHFVVRSLIHEAALGAGLAPQTLSFTHAVRVLRRRLPAAIALPPWGSQSVAPL